MGLGKSAPSFETSILPLKRKRISNLCSFIWPENLFNNKLGSFNVCQNEKFTSHFNSRSEQTIQDWHGDKNGGFQPEKARIGRQLHRRQEKAALCAPYITSSGWCQERWREGVIIMTRDWEYTQFSYDRINNLIFHDHSKCSRLLSIYLRALMMRCIYWKSSSWY